MIQTMRQFIQRVVRIAARPALRLIEQSEAVALARLERAHASQVEELSRVARASAEMVAMHQAEWARQRACQRAELEAFRSTSDRMLQQIEQSGAAAIRHLQDTRALHSTEIGNAAHATLESIVSSQSDWASKRTLLQDELEAIRTACDGMQRRLGATSRRVTFALSHAQLLEDLRRDIRTSTAGAVPPLDLSGRVRSIVRQYAGLAKVTGNESQEDLLAELRTLRECSDLVRPFLAEIRSKRVLFAGQCYYNLWYLSRELRRLGWKADLLNWDSNPASHIYYHGEDFRFSGLPDEGVRTLRFYVEALYGYDIFHFSNAHGIAFGWSLSSLMAREFDEHAEIHLLRELGKKIVYTNNGCLDGVAQSSFSKWGPESPCATCRWRSEASVCSDRRNLEWGAFRNSVADYQCLLGGNRVDYNDDPRVHENPWVYCLDESIWTPELQVPLSMRIPRSTPQTLLLYHAVGNKGDRTTDGVNIKSSHVYLPLVEKLQRAGWDLSLIEPQGVPNREIRFLQVQADVVLEMLTFGWFGANAREAMMLGKPVVCFIRPEWLASLREELPEYADELPIVQATPETVEVVLLDLLSDAAKRKDIGRRSRDFMLRWHASTAAAAHFDRIYSRMLAGDLLLRPRAAAAAPADA